ncbi:TQO small subunit DoxD [Legionella gratiana]|uniref:TQO small subunit DoxD n=1 Tax=Legionella gratiana TaxID=45066 RepID=A0A378JA66_9GAMM|nr:TQO small subunit DoxD [Legionella gratiana]KTD10985.1 TQO small subunit DoxD [Legionella gratiana]STX44672.1 TQO small subunit DoxD [Legionella gratiana]
MELNYKDATKNIYEWRMFGWLALSIRFVQGWIFWGGGSRRFIYAPQKIDPYSTQWMANKIQSAMPGALFDLSPVVSFLLHHFTFLYAAIILFSLVELLSGLGLIFGFFTRASAMLTVFISIVLMILFGWQGSTCLDEWTMAVSNLSMGLTLFLTGGTVCSIDAWIIKRHPQLAQKSWFQFLNSGPWAYATIKKTALIFFIFTAIFSVGTYNYYRGAVFTPYHAGPVNPDVFHLDLARGQLQKDGTVHFTITVNSGPSSTPSYIMRIELLNNTKDEVEIWTASQLSLLPQSAILNSYDYNKIGVDMYGLIAPESAKAEITLPPTKIIILPSGHYFLRVYTIDGKRWDLKLTGPPNQ